MAFSRDWLEVNPIDHSKFKEAPGAIRETKVDVSDRLKSILSGFTSGETAWGIKLGKYLTTGTAAPAAPTGTGVAQDMNMYVRTNGTGPYADLYLRGTSGPEMQLTTKNAKINTAALDTTKSLWSTIFGLIYPVGCIYTETTGVNPATTFEVGTWAAFGAGRVLLGNGGGYAAANTGGAATVTLTAAEMPAHTHTYEMGGASGGNTMPYSGSGAQGPTPATSSTGGGGAHNNMQPYVVVYFWQRTA